MLTTISHPDELLPAITHIPLVDPYGRQPGTPLFRSYTPNLKIYDGDATKVKANKLIQNSMITVRDYNLLRTLLGVGILSRQQIQRLFWTPGTSLSTVNRRLKLQADRGVLISTMTYRDMLSDLGLERCALYGLGDVAREILAARSGLQSSRTIAYNPKYYAILADNPLVRHHVMTAEIYTRLKEKSNRADNEMVWFIEMACIIRDGDRELVRPDAYAVIGREEDKEEAHLFIETDTRNTNWEKKIQSYELARSRGNWREVLGSDWFPLVLCVVPNEHAVVRVANLIKSQSANVAYLLKAWPQFLVEDPYTGWYHAQGEAGGELVKILPDHLIQERS